MSDYPNGRGERRGVINRKESAYRLYSINISILFV
jgi:hypothetical protein